MTRVLQIRRGTTEQNDNFTGLSGELSFDTVGKTLRVHDGETLGGFTLARADQISASSSGDGTTSDFDINSIDTSFWENLFATYSQTSIQISESSLVTISNVSYLEYIFDVSGPAKLAQVVLVCQTPEAGYSINDVVSAFGIGSRTNPTPNTFVDANGTHSRLLVASENFWVSHKTSGVQTNITNANWKAKFVIWY